MPYLDMAYISVEDELYPALLKEIRNPPKRLYFKGNIELLKYRCITIVGTRYPSGYGIEVVETLLDQGIPAYRDICIASGMAKGIDTAVHSQCLKWKIPTIAILPAGVENIYPKSNTKLYGNILKNNGLILSEYDGVQKLKRCSFVIRDRLLAGISYSTLIIESRLSGGSIVTADLALKENRQVLAIPHSIREESLQGCNMLLKRGAKPILSQDDLVSVLKCSQEQMKLYK
jgi:DNA processing protein